MKIKETFCSYTDFNDGNWKKMNEEIEELKNELEKTRNIVRVQRVRYQQLVSLFSAKLQEKEEETRNDLQIKHIQLTRILRALYILESKLRKEQKTLKTSLLERDVVIRSQEVEIRRLRTELERVVSSRTQKFESKRSNACRVKDEDGTATKTVFCESKTNADNKPDLISSIGIELLNDVEEDNTNSRVVKEFKPVSSGKLENNEENTYVISSLDDYDASLSSLHVRGASDGEDHEDEQTKDFPQTGSADELENNQNANNENICNRMIDEELQNEMRKFKMKDLVMQDDDELQEILFNGNCANPSSPRMILKEVTENPSEKLHGPVLKCVQQILSDETKGGKQALAAKPTKSSGSSRENSKVYEKVSALEGICDGTGETTQRRPLHPVKPPKPNFTETQYQRPLKKRSVSFETNLPGAFLFENTLSVRPLPKVDKHQNKDLVYDVKAKKNEDKNGNVGTSDESKIIQTVSALLSESAESDDEKAETTSPTVLQMVKKFEGLKSKKKKMLQKNNSVPGMNTPKCDSILFQTNFEEFHLVDKEIESTCEDMVKDTNSNIIRLQGEGEENSVASTVIESTNTTAASNAKYEAFLEVTGLSQKSILTPSRILSNHRSVVKPKDVKYRNRVKAAAFGEKCGNGTAASPTTKYWTEPFL